MPPHPFRDLSRIQAFLLHGVLPIVVIGLLLPVGMVAMFLLFQEEPVAQAVDHGELYLAAGNASFTGCLVLISSRRDQAVNALIAALFVVAVLVVPCYASWAYFSVQALVGESYSTRLAADGGIVAVVGSCVVALVLVHLSFTRSAEANASKG